jgi:hypothetical protein
MRPAHRYKRRQNRAPRPRFEAMMKDPTAQAHMREAAGIATSFNPIY